jgi:hypothetical protein
VDRHPFEAIARTGMSEEVPAMRTTEAIANYDLVAFRDNVEHVAARVGERFDEPFVERAPRTGSDTGVCRGKAEITRPRNSG